jgi:heme-degrading monooxygenase HmoA
MCHVLTNHTITDFDRFKTIWDDDSDRRRLAGSMGARLFRVADKPNEIVALYEWDDVEKAKKWAASYQLREAVEWAGVIGGPKMLVIEEIGQASA